MEPEPNQIPASTELLMMGRHALGSLQLMGDSSLPSSITPLLYQQLEKSTQNCWDQIRFISLAAELKGREEALTLLDSLVPDTGLSEQTEHAFLTDLSSLRAIYTEQHDSLTESQRQGLIDRHDWFARLSLTFNLPDQDPLRKQALAPALRAEAAILAALITAPLALILGIILCVMAILTHKAGNLVLRYPPVLEHSQTVNTAYLEIMVLYLSLFPLLSLLRGFLPTGLGMPLSMGLPLFLPLWALKRGVSWPQLKLNLGWIRGKGILRELGCGLVGYLAGLPLLLIGFLVTALLLQLVSVDPSHPIAHEFAGSSPNRLLGLFLLACVGAPIVEETLFRGVFYHHLRRGMSAFFAIALQALVFAAIHPQGLVAIPLLMAVGSTLACIREWRGSLIAPIAAHALNNGLALCMMILILW